MAMCHSVGALCRGLGGEPPDENSEVSFSVDPLSAHEPLVKPGSPSAVSAQEKTFFLKPPFPPRTQGKQPYAIAMTSHSPPQIAGTDKSTDTRDHQLPGVFHGAIRFLPQLH